MLIATLVVTVIGLVRRRMRGAHTEHPEPARERRPLRERVREAARHPAAVIAAASGTVGVAVATGVVATC